MVSGVVIWLQALAMEVTRVSLEIKVNWAVRLSFGVWEQLTVSVSICVFILLLVDYNDISRSIQCAELYEPSTIYRGCHGHRCGGGDPLFHGHGRGQIIVCMY